MIHTLQFMKAMILGFDAKRRSEEGATAVEYGLLVALIAAGIVIIVATLGDTITAAFTDTNTEINNNLP